MNEDSIKGKIIGPASISAPSTNDQSVDLYEDQLTSVNEINSLPPASIDVASEMKDYTCMAPNSILEESSDPAASISWQRKEADGIIMRQLVDVVSLLLLFPCL
jgi:hypothetical protein